MPEENGFPRRSAPRNDKQSLRLCVSLSYGAKFTRILSLSRSATAPSSVGAKGLVNLLPPPPLKIFRKNKGKYFFASYKRIRRVNYPKTTQRWCCNVLSQRRTRTRRALHNRPIWPSVRKFARTPYAPRRMMHPHLLSEGYRPYHPLQIFPPPQAQDAGLSPAGGRPLPHAPDPHAGGQPPCAHRRAGAHAERRSGRGDSAGARSGAYPIRPRRRARAGEDIPRRLQALRAEPARCGHS